MLKKIYLDDVRTPLDTEWIVVRSYDSFVEKVSYLELKNIGAISLDHDLGSSAMQEFYHNVITNYKLDYRNIDEKTGYDCAKWLVEHHMRFGGKFPVVYTHSANPVGSSNIMGYINAYLMSIDQPQTCIRIKIDHKVQ